MPDDAEAMQILLEYPDEPRYFPYKKGSTASKTSLRKSLTSSTEDVVDQEQNDDD